MTVVARTSSGGFELELDLDRTDLLPGRPVSGTLRVTAPRGGAIRGARVVLAGAERWRFDRTTMGANGQTHTEIATGEEDLPSIPVEVMGPTTFAAGEPRSVDFQVPVPGLGPATFEATELAVTWQIHVNLDVAGFDPSLSVAVRILQPTALLRAGVLDVAEFALYAEAEAEADGFAGSIWLDPSPLCVGASFKGRLTLAAAPTRQVQDVRLELRVKAQSTVSGGRDETITLWSGLLSGAGAFGGQQTLEFAGVLPATWLPTIQTKHGRADARFHVIVATAFARDPHLVRDVTVCSTTEI